MELEYIPNRWARLQKFQTAICFLQFWLDSSSCSCPLTNSETFFRLTCLASNIPGQTGLGQWRIYSIRYIPPSWPILCLFPRSALFPRSLLASERRLLAEVHAAQRARAFQLSAFNPVCQLVLMLQREIWGRKAAWNIYKKKTTLRIPLEKATRHRAGWTAVCWW